jgi:hypothetical protein
MNPLTQIYKEEVPVIKILQGSSKQLFSFLQILNFNEAEVKK